MANAYGYIDLQHLYNQRISEVGVPIIRQALDASLAYHTRQLNELMSAFVIRTTLAQEAYRLPSGGTLQPLDEHGVPLPRKGGKYNQVAYPIKGAGTAWGDDRVTRALMTVEEANEATLDAQMQDADWLKRHILAAVLNNESYPFEDLVGPKNSKGLGEITIKPLANGDSDEYLNSVGEVVTDNHYLAQAAAIADATNPYPTIKNELLEHPSNAGGDVVSFIPTNLTTTTKALADFTPIADPDIQPGSGESRLLRTIGRGFGDEVLGKVGSVWIVEWKSLPDNYILSHARGGGPVLKMREYPAPELQGLITEQFTINGNHSQTSLIRYCGFGCFNRVGAVVYRIGNGTYATPTGYNNPLAI